MALDENLSKPKRPDLVGDLVDRHASEADIVELFNFGKFMFANQDDRVKAIEGKSVAMIGYSSAILAFLVTRSKDYAANPLVGACLIAVGIFAGIACFFAYYAVRAAAWSSLTEETWFPDPSVVMGGAGSLTRWYIKEMHVMYKNNQTIANSKSVQMKAGQICLAIAGGLLAVALIANLWLGFFTANP